MPAERVFLLSRVCLFTSFVPGGLLFLIFEVNSKGLTLHGTPLASSLHTHTYIHKDSVTHSPTHSLTHSLTLCYQPIITHSLNYKSRYRVPMWRFQEWRLHFQSWSIYNVLTRSFFYAQISLEDLRNLLVNTWLYCRFYVSEFTNTCTHIHTPNLLVLDQKALPTNTNWLSIE